MLPKSERFADSRVDRYRDTPWVRNPAFGYRVTRKQVSKTLAHYFRDCRLDRRFALPRLYAAMAKHGAYTECHTLDAWVRPLHARAWERDPRIDASLYTATAAHRAEGDRTKIACYPTRADAARGREVVMTAGRFFAAVYPFATAAETQRMSEEYTHDAKPPVVHFVDNSDPDGWARVYASNRGFHSCMSGWGADDGLHPARFYAYPGNGLELAYLTHNGRPDGETVARCITHRAKGVYVRVYGDARLASALESQGLRLDAYRALNGVNCRATVDGSRLVAPYLDACGSVRWAWGDGYCTISDSGLDAQNTDGFAQMEDERNICNDCGDPMDEDEECYSEHHDVTVCSHCCDRYFTYAMVDRRRNRDYVRDDDVIEIAGECYLNDDGLLSDLDFVQDIDGDWQDSDDCIYLDYLGEYVLSDDCTRLDIPHGDDEYARDIDVITVTIMGDEKTVHEDYDGPTDEKIAQAVADARAKFARRKVRTFSRAPGKRANKSQARRRVVARALEAVL